ncbi:hypothetical protein CIB84_009526 [Bambusicola thoracicus]|uniref:Uncharacterized protein n=1 Tax=Bambusicola thoracicus TaxID=9083 RepID=A0A2P4SRI8_BAMTH|nr:hypothetical protein CIB84_009526 [Bambusicola thoracicus]
MMMIQIRTKSDIKSVASFPK